MNFVNEYQLNIKTSHLRILLWMFSGVLLSLVIQNAESAENIAKPIQHTVEISSFEFVPKQLEVKVGDTITWINKDIVPHNIIDSINQQTISPELATGESYAFIVEKPIIYHCGLHPSMKGKLSLLLVP